MKYLYKQLEEGVTMKNLKMYHEKNECFTLIELLVVISIIGILAGLLFPALNQAREKARSAACMGNMKQFSQYLLFYANDFNTFPCSTNYKDALGNGTYWLDVWAQSMKLKKYSVMYGLTKFSPSQTIFYCPSEPIDRYKDTAKIGYKQSCYGLNTATATSGGTGWYAYPARKMDRLPNPSRMCLLFETNGFDWLTTTILCTYTTNLYDGNNGPAPKFRHTSSANSAFVDGHVSLMHRKRVPCKESFPAAGDANISNTYFNRGEVYMPDSSTYTIIGY